MEAQTAAIYEYKIGARPVITQAEHRDKRDKAVVPYAPILDRRLTHCDFRVFACLCSYAKKTGFCYPSQARISADLTVSRQAVNRALKKLKQLGYVREEKSAIKGKKGKTLLVVFGNSDADKKMSSTERAAILSNEADYRPEEQRQKEEQQIQREQIKMVKKLSSSVIANHLQIIKNNGKNKARSMSVLDKHGIDYKHVMGTKWNSTVPNEGDEKCNTTVPNDQNGTVRLHVENSGVTQTKNINIVNIYNDCVTKSLSLMSDKLSPDDEHLVELIANSGKTEQDWKQFCQQYPDIPFSRLAQAFLYR